MTGWIIALSILAFLTLLLFCSIHFEVIYKDGEARVRLRYLFLRFRLFPKKEKKKRKVEKEAGEEKEKEKPEEEKSAEKKKKTDFETLKNLVGSGYAGLKTIWRHLVFRVFVLRIVVGDEDAAECAMQYGKLCAYVYGGLAVAKNLMKLGTREISLSCDFEKNKTEYEVQASAKIRVVFIFGAAFRMLFHFIANTIRN